jgi:hypothetical protein
MEHPRWTLSGLASLAAIIPAAIYIGGWLGGLVETPWHAQAREDKIRADMDVKQTAVLGEIGKLRAAVETQWANDKRQNAGVLLQLMENKVYVARNRLNDCNIAKQAGKTTPLERAACSQYEGDYADAVRRYEQQQNQASQVWRGQ